MIDWRQHLSSELNVCHGQLCAKGTRVLVTNILDSLAEGATRDQVLHSYPPATGRASVLAFIRAADGPPRPRPRRARSCRVRDRYSSPLTPGPNHTRAADLSADGLMARLRAIERD